MHWNIQNQKEDFTVSKNRLHPVVEGLLQKRGLTSEVEQDIFLSPDYSRDIHDPFLFSAMETVVERVTKAKVEQQKIGIFGDFDADGVTSSALLRTAFENLGVLFAIYLPDKLTEGHGLNKKAVDFFAAEGASLIFTLDCGMMNHEEILYAKEKGIDTIIVDHHHVPEVLPEAVAIINPKLLNESYPFRELCGAGTTFKVVQALTEKLAPESTEQLKWMLDIVAIGTVADVMPLIGENRVLVKYGLLVLSKTRNLGLQALLQVAGIDFERGTVCDAELIAFQIAPRINAASRMAHARIAHDLLMAKTETEALELAKQLQQLNVARQKESRAITKEITQYIEEQKKDAQFLFAAAPHYPYGIVGLVAGRLANLYQKPTAILTKGEETSRGSFRSVPGFSVIIALEKCADLLIRYGGHEAAAGMYIQNDNLEAFEERFNALVEEWKQTQEAVTHTDTVLFVDAEISPVSISNELLRDMNKLAPFGEGNREPLFVLRSLLIQQIRTLGKDNEHLKLTLKIGNKTIDAIGFHLAEKNGHLEAGMPIDIAATLGENIWNGRRSLQLKLVDIHSGNRT